MLQQRATEAAQTLRSFAALEQEFQRLRTKTERENWVQVYDTDSWEEVQSIQARLEEEELKKEYPDTLVILVWDNAPCHRPKVHREIPGLIVLFLPPYSPQLNPAERFFEELRRATADSIFKTIEEQEKVIEKALNEWADDLGRMKQLLGYDWILKQCGRVC